jgi:AGZA family xanthine/uracil permease-like MFS transporter
MQGLEHYFELYQHDKTLSHEVLAGVTRFPTITYIIFVNLANLSNTGLDRDPVFIEVRLSVAISCLLMGLLANCSIPLALGMGPFDFLLIRLWVTMEHFW